jgi:hypothetical protein
VGVSRSAAGLILEAALADFGLAYLPWSTPLGPEQADAGSMIRDLARDEGRRSTGALALGRCEGTPADRRRN